MRFLSCQGQGAPPPECTILVFHVDQSHQENELAEGYTDREPRPAYRQMVSILFVWYAFFLFFSFLFEYH